MNDDMTAQEAIEHVYGILDDKQEGEVIPVGMITAHAEVTKFLEWMMSDEFRLLREELIERMKEGADER